jgi:superfamily II DNA or RNA helicase
VQIILRPDQQLLTDGIEYGWQSGNRNMLGVLPTGGGKSVIVSGIVLKHHNLGESQAVIAHRKELIGQMSLHIARRGIKHRIIGPKETISQIVASHRRELNGYSFVSPTANCSVAGIDTLLARQKELEPWAKQINRWYLDEGHHLLAENKWGRGVAMFPNAYGLGVTASPGRADGMGLGRHCDGLYDGMVVGPSTRELMDIGAITDYEYVVPASDFKIDDNAITDTGDYSPKKMREASQKSHIVGDVVKEYVRRAFGKRAICFATDVETANEIAKNFNAAGIPAASVSAQTSDALRDEYVRRFKEGKIWILVNVDLFGEGFDVPAVEVVIMARPTASLSVYLQQCGRALRAMEGKLFGLIIDHVSNYKRHGLPDKKRFWTLDRREKRGRRPLDPEEIPMTVCRNCSKPYERIYSCCPYCGTIPEVAPGGRASIEQIDGDLILLDRDRLAEMRAAGDLESPDSVGARVGAVAGIYAGKAAINNQIERILAQQRLDLAIANWAGMQRILGRDDQQSYRRFYLTLGVDVLTARSLPRADMEKLSDTIEGWIK